METIKAGLIFELIPKIMGELGPIGKDNDRFKNGDGSSWMRKDSGY